MWCSATRGLHHAGQNYSASIRLAVSTEFALTPQALPDWQLLRGAAWALQKGGRYAWWVMEGASSQTFGIATRIESPQQVNRFFLVHCRLTRVRCMQSRWNDAATKQ